MVVAYGITPSGRRLDCDEDDTSAYAFILRLIQQDSFTWHPASNLMAQFAEHRMAHMIDCTLDDKRTRRRICRHLCGIAGSALQELLADGHISRLYLF
jgi:hypothetical protein